MHSGFLPKEDREIEDIWNWFDDQSTALLDYRHKTIQAITEGLPVNKQFKSFLSEDPKTIDELDDYFDNSERNLEHLVCLDLITAAEALIRLDYLARIRGKRKVFLAKSFSELYKKKGNRASLEWDIVETWKDSIDTDKKYFSYFLGLLNYRNWLAHGRYWDAMLGEKYTPEKTFQIVKKIKGIIEINR